MSIAIKKIYVLLVEDVESDRMLFCSYIQQYGSTVAEIDVHSVPSLAEAVKYVKENMVDIIVLDLNLPDSIGVEALLKITSVAPWVPIVVLTGDESFKEDCMKVPATKVYFVKGNIDAQSMTDALLRVYGEVNGS